MPATAVDKLVDALRDNGRNVVVNGDRVQAQCPAHDDTSPSLSITRIDGSALVHCHAGCETVDVLAAVGLTMADLYDDRRGATYRYPDGRMVHRSPTKQFRQSGNTKGKALFHADRIDGAPLVYVCEGEKDVLAVESAGGVAVCPAMGAGKAHLFDWSPLRGVDVVVVADRDEPGGKHADQVAALLADVTSSVRVTVPAVGKDAADHVAAGCGLHELVPVQADDTSERESIFDARPVLKHVRDFARARRVNPLSTLGVLLVRAVCQIPPHVVLPPLVGGYAAVNMSVALVGPSAGGKGSSEAAARDAVDFVNPMLSEDIPEFPIGSGEGIARTFADAGAETVTTAIFSVAEVDTLAALFRRQGSTLEGELRKAWMGEQLGFTNAQKATRTNVPRLSYRAGLVVGVQPLRAGALLHGADGGTPQRFVWMPTLDANMPQHRPQPVDPMTVDVPAWPSPGPDCRYVVLEVPEVARIDIDRHQIALHRGDPDADPLGGHALLCRLKVAAALMVLDGRQAMTDEDWTLAGRIMDISSATRARVQQAMSERSRHANRARALDAAERDEIISDRKLERCKHAILRGLDPLPGEHVSRNELRRSLRSELRAYFDAAMTELTKSGSVAEVNISGGTAYTLRPPRPPRPPLTTSSDAASTGVDARPPLTAHAVHEQGKRAESRPPQHDSANQPPRAAVCVQQTRNGSMCADCHRRPPTNGRRCDECQRIHTNVMSGYEQ